MRKIKIKFMGMGCYPRCQAKVKIFDWQNCLVAKGITECGEFCFLAKEKSFYKVSYYLNGIVNWKTIYINNSWNSYPFFYQGVVDNRIQTITFRLTDQNYANLPISKGEMTLWQK